MSSNNNNTVLIVFAVLAAFGLVMATVAVLPIIPQAHADNNKLHKLCKDGTEQPCNGSHKGK